MPKTPTFGSERVSMELHCGSPLSSLAVSCSQVGEAQLWQRGLRQGLVTLECDCRTESAADQQHPAHAALHVLSCLLITLKPGMNSIPPGAQVLLLPSTQPRCFLPSSCLESSQGRARHCPSTEQPCEAIPQMTCGKQPVLTLHKSQQV